MPSKSDMRRSTNSSTQSPRRPPKADSTASFPTPTSSSNSSQRDGSANRSNGKRGSSTNNHRGTNKSQNYSDNTRITSRNLFSYLESLQRETLLSLYGKSGNDPTTTDTMTIDPRCRYFARTILQRLPEMGRQFAIRLALCGGSFPSNLVECWCRGKAGRREMERSLRRMEILCVIEPTVDVESGTDGVDNESTNGIEGGDNGKAAKPKIVSLTSEFRTSLKTSLTSLRASPWDEVTGEQMAELQKRSSGDGSASNRTAPPTPVELEEFTRRRWNGVLHFLAGSDDDGAEDPPQAVVGFLEQTGLMQEDPDSKRWSGGVENEQEAPLIMTSKGYDFMLQEIHVQVWQFILQYIQTIVMAASGKENNGSDESAKARSARGEELRVEVLLFLVCLSYCQVGAAYPASSLGRAESKFMRDLSNFGLIYRFKIGKTKFFYPTRVAVGLVVAGLEDFDESNQLLGRNQSSAATSALEVSLIAPVPSDVHIAIIVQTNFQVCAYTTSSLHLSMLGLFCDVSNFRRLPNVIFYRITRDSVKAAFMLGIGSAQILRFLRMHAHPRLMSGDRSPLPPNVEDQILLWDQERTRVQFEEVYKYQCKNNAEFHAVRTYAQNGGWLGWSDESKNILLIKFDGAEVVLAYAERWKASSSSAGKNIKRRRRQ